MCASLSGKCFVLPHHRGTFLSRLATGYISLRNSWEQGAPTGNEINVTKAGSSKPKTFIGGYSLLQAEDADAVKSMLSDHPHFMMEGNSIEVLEVMPMPGM